MGQLSSLRSWRPMHLKISGYILLVILAFATEYGSIPWFYGYHLEPGSFFLLLILLLYGPSWAIPASVAVYGSLAVLDAATWLQILPLIAFIASAGLLLKRFPDRLLPIAAVYWMLVGLPASYLGYIQETGYRDGLGYLFALNEAMNAILATLAADVLLSYSPLRRWLAPERGPSGFAFNRIVLHLTLVATAVPFFVFILFNAYQDNQAAIEQAAKHLDSQVGIVNRDLAGWSENDYRDLRLNGILQTGELKGDLALDSDGKGSVSLAFLDSNGRIVAGIGLYSSWIGQEYDWRAGGIVEARYHSDSLWMPSVQVPFSSEQLRYSYLVRETTVGAGKQAVFLLPFSAYLELPVRSSISHIQLLLAFIMITMLLTMLLNRFFLTSFTRLAKATTGIPDKISQGGALEWPRSGILEVRLLSDNFRSVADHLARMFRQMLNANAQLNQQKEQLAISERRLAQLAYYDHLTGLPNRLSMKERLMKELDAAAAEGWNVYLTVVFIDLDRFKHVNDTLGHIVGDDLLCQVTERLSRALPNDAFIARIGGDEFVLLLRHVDPDAASRTSERVLEQFRDPFSLHGHTLYVTPSMGLATAPYHGRDINTLMSNADSAMYATKENGGKGYAIYSEALNTRISQAMWLENNLHEALINEEFELHYQPKVHSSSGNLSGMEALVRWNHPVQGLISPNDFIPVAEQTGLIIPLGDWILRTACEQNVKWQRAGMPPLRVAVNLSARQFHNPRLLETVKGILADTGMPGRFLELEITEGYLLTNEAYVVEVLQRLRELGIVISIDDFGTGYSSLSQLRKFPVQAVKIDKSFILGMDRDFSNDSIVKAVIQLAHSMNLNVVAEGVETPEVESLLRQYGCDELQGYLFWKPLSAASMEDLLRKMTSRQSEGEMA